MEYICVQYLTVLYGERCFETRVPLLGLSLRSFGCWQNGPEAINETFVSRLLPEVLAAVPVSSDSPESTQDQVDVRRSVT